MGLPTGMSFGIYELQTHSRVPLIPLTCPPSSRLLGVSLHCPRLLLDVASSMLFLTPQTPDQLAMQSDASATHRELGCSPILPAMVPQSQISDLSAPGLWVALCASVCMHDFPVGLSNTQVSTAPSLSLKVQVQVCTVPQLARPCGTVSICPCATFQPFTQDLTNHGYLNHGQIHLPLRNKIKQQANLPDFRGRHSLLSVKLTSSKTVFCMECVCVRAIPAVEVRGKLW